MVRAAMIMLAVVSLVGCSAGSDSQCVDHLCGDTDLGRTNVSDIGPESRPGDQVRMVTDTAEELSAADSGEDQAELQDIPSGPCQSYPISLECFAIDDLSPGDCAVEYPVPVEFHAAVDQLFLSALEDHPDFPVDRANFPVYDFTPDTGPKGRLSWELTARHDYFALPGYLEGFAVQLAQAGSSSALLAFLSDKADNCVDPNAVEPLWQQCSELFMKPDGLPPALALLWQSAGNSDTPPALLTQWTPPDMHPPLARFICALAVANMLVTDAFALAYAQIPASAALYQMAAAARTFDDLAAPDGLAAFAQLTDFRQLYHALALLALAAENLAEDLDDMQLQGVKLMLTPLGAIALAGTEDNVHGDVPPGYLAIVDLGGNDNYLSAAAATRPGVPLSVLVDIGGDDNYDNAVDPAPAFAAAHLGVALLWDAAGDDSYRSSFDSIASACLGTAMLVDLKGADSYDSVSSSQASATLGIALLDDRSGDDTYYSFRASQSYASFKGATLLLDRAGDDKYIAERDLVIYPAAQNKNVNANMCQGAGQGYRNDEAGLPNTFPGGVAVMADLEGDDIYSAGIFAGAVGYWFGLGVQLDLDGADSYEGVWYNQGASAHFAAGLHADYGQGDDYYYCAQDQCIGEGRDYSVAMSINESGNDEYWGKGARNIGSGDLFGLGFFWDLSGDDSYRVDSYTGVGAAFSDTDNENSITFGLFLDQGGGQDTYQHDGQCADSTFWSQVGNKNDGIMKNVLAVGRDN